MIRKVARRVLLPFAACLLVVAAVSVTGLTAANTVPETGASDLQVAFNPAPAVPAECGGIAIESTISDNGGVVFGSNGNDLIIGGPSGQLLFAANGTDCVFGGGGNDWVFGDNGRDVLLGGPGDDTIWGGSAPDTCYGGPGNDTFYECETIIDD